MQASFGGTKTTPLPTQAPLQAPHSSATKHTNTNGFLLASFFVDQLHRINESLLHRSLGYDLGEENIDYITNVAYAAMGIGAIYTGAYLSLPLLAAAYANNFLNGQGYSYKEELYKYLGIDNYYGRALDLALSSTVLYMQFGTPAILGATLFEGTKIAISYLTENNQEYYIDKLLPAAFQGYSDVVTSMIVFVAAEDISSNVAVGAGALTALIYASELFWAIHDKPPKIVSHVHKPVNCICVKSTDTQVAKEIIQGTDTQVAGEIIQSTDTQVAGESIALIEQN